MRGVGIVGGARILRGFIVDDEVDVDGEVRNSGVGEDGMDVDEDGKDGAVVVGGVVERGLSGGS